MSGYEQTSKQQKSKQKRNKITNKRTDINYNKSQIFVVKVSSSKKRKKKLWDFFFFFGEKRVFGN